MAAFPVVVGAVLGPAVVGATVRAAQLAVPVQHPISAASVAPSLDKT